MRRLSPRRFGTLIAAAFGLVALLSARSVSAHHGWGGYLDAEFEITGTVESSVSLAGPHASMTIKGTDGHVWNLVLAPPPRSQQAGLKDGMIPVGAKVTAHGHRHRDNDRLRGQDRAADVGRQGLQRLPRSFLTCSTPRSGCRARPSATSCASRAPGRTRSSTSRTSWALRRSSARCSCSICGCVGLGRRIPLAALAEATVPVAATGFLIAAATGVGLLVTKATEYVGNPFLAIKFPAILLALINVLVHQPIRGLAGPRTAGAVAARTSPAGRDGRAVAGLLADRDRRRPPHRVLVAAHALPPAVAAVC